MASTRLDLAYQFPLPLGPVTSFGLRSGYSLRSFKGAVYDAALGSDGNALLALHAVPFMTLNALAFSSDKALIFNAPARSAIYAGLGGNLLFGQAQAFGRKQQILQFVPA